MPLTINGFGTAYFGKKDADEQGIYVTTKFIVALHIPILPLASFWVMPYGTPVTTGLIRIQEFDAVRIPLNWKQVLSIYFKWYVGLAVVFTSILFIMQVFIEYRDLSEGKPRRYSISQSETTRNIAAYLLSLSSSGTPQKREAN
jgi:hypothetical protein